MAITVKHIFIHPVKSMAGQMVEEALLTADGLAGDRQFVVVNEKGKFRTARECPSLLIIKAVTMDDLLVLSQPNGRSISIPLMPQDQELKKIKLWDDDVTGADMGDDAARWLSDYLGKASRLISIADKSVRQGKYRGTPKSFADASPLLLTSNASLNDLNRRLSVPVIDRNFRPNIVVTGDMEPFGEDLWAEIKIGDIVMQVAWGCNRCILTTVDPLTGSKSDDMEPVKTLKTFRTAADKNFYFGQNIIPQTQGTIHVGDAVEIISVRKKPLYAADALL